MLKQGVHRLHLSDPCSAVSVTKGSSVATLELSSLTARHAAVAVKPLTQRSDALDSGRRRGVVVSNPSQRGVVDVEQLGGRHVM